MQSYVPCARDRVELCAEICEDLCERRFRQLQLDGAGFESADVEQCVQQARHALDRLVLLVQQLANIGLRHDLQHRCIQQTHRLQRLTQIMARGGEKPALRAIRSIRFLTRRHQRFVDAFALGDIANGGGDVQTPVRRPERRESNAGGKLRAIASPGGQVRDADAHLTGARVLDEPLDLHAVLRTQALGTSVSSGWPISSSGLYPSNSMTESLAKQICPRASTTTMASGEKRINSWVMSLGEFMQPEHSGGSRGGAARTRAPHARGEPHRRKPSPEGRRAL